MAWTFDPRLGGSRRDDGTYFHASLNTSAEVWNPTQPDWVWLVYRPNRTILRLNPEKHNLQTPADVETFIDADLTPRPPPSEDEPEAATPPPA